jgi:hypothetical protein
MRIARIVVGVVMVLLGGIWTLQGANILTGSALMSGQSQWLWIGVAVVIAGALLLWSTLRGRA